MRVITTKKGLPRPISKAFNTNTKTNLTKSRQAIIKEVLVKIYN